MKEVFKCRICGECCHGRGGIYIRPEDAAAPAAILGMSTEEFIRRFTEPWRGMLSIKADADGYCLMADRQNGTCRIHEAKPAMCRDWPFFAGPLHDRDAFEEARAACPGIDPEATWEEFVEYNRVHIRTYPPRSYIKGEEER